MARFILDPGTPRPDDGDSWSIKVGNPFEGWHFGTRYTWLWRKPESALPLLRELAFHDALAEKPEVLKARADETLKGLAMELTEKLRGSTSVDWQVRDSVRARMRLLIKRLLRKYRYPPEGQEDAVKRVIEQAEALADAWSNQCAQMR